jgi:hypothetical protein
MYIMDSDNYYRNDKLQALNTRNQISDKIYFVSCTLNEFTKTALFD